jgi:hypothetical protein
MHGVARAGGAEVIEEGPGAPWPTKAVTVADLVVLGSCESGLSDRRP